MEFDLLIHGGDVIDGTGVARQRADVGVLAGRVAAIGDLRDAVAQQVIDASQRIVAPGFIDVHNHSDGWVCRDKQQSFKTMQGFTTEVLMSDGISYAPVDETTWRDWFFYLRSLNGLRMQDYTGWESLDDYMTLLDGNCVQNVATQIPYANLRTLVNGFNQTPIDDSQMVRIQKLVRECLAAGAVALSTGLDYIAQCFASTEELIDACRPMAESQTPYVTHMRYKKTLIPGIEEAIEIGRQAGVPVHISHLKCQSPYDPEQIFKLIDDACGEGIPTTFDVYPYQPGSTMLNYLLPYEAWKYGPLAACGVIGESEFRRVFKSAFDAYRLDLDHVRVAWSPSGERIDDWGKTLQQIVDESGKDMTDALLDYLLDEQLAVLCVMDEGDDKEVEPFVAHPRCMMGTDAIYQIGGKVHPRAYGSAGRWLGPLVRDAKIFTLEEAIRKMTSLSAHTFGLEDRGVLAVDRPADIVVFNEATINDNASFSEPTNSCDGIEHVLVNGVAVVASGEHVEIVEQYPGQRIRYRK